MTDPSKPDAKTGSSSLRQFLLIGLLVLLVIGLIYDYKVARPGVSEAYDKITEQSMLTNMSSTNVFTDKDVQELLGKAPSRSFDEPNGEMVEVYSWRSGLPIRTHDLFAVYKKSGENWMFHRHSKYEYEPSAEVYEYSSSETVIDQPSGANQSSPQPAAGVATGGGSSDEAYRSRDSNDDGTEGGDDEAGEGGDDSDQPRSRPEVETEEAPAASDEQE